MLQELHIQNLALAESLHLDLSSHGAGLIAFTGETGAGKSIILQAIGLLAGGRSASSWIRGGCEQASIEAVFSVRPEQEAVRALLDEHALENGDTCLVRRVVSREGRSRIYVNDQSVTAKLVADLAAALFNIASQHDQQQLLNTRSHLDYLDAYGELWPLRREFGLLFSRWQRAAAELRRLEEQERDKEQRRDFLRFQLDEIRKVQPRAGEDEELQKERERLKAADTLIRLAAGGRSLLDDTVLPALAELKKRMGQLAGLDGDIQPLAERMHSAGFEMEDMAETLRHYGERLVADPARLDAIAERLGDLKSLQRKYGPGLDDVIAFAGRAEEELAHLDKLEEQITRAARAEQAAAEEVLAKGAELTAARREKAARLVAAMERELASLSFPQAAFQVHFREEEGKNIEAGHASGRDNVEFLFSANPGEAPKALARIASGGELSRLMLAMKCLLARRDQVDTVIFDEIDSGISGQAAEAVAAKIRELAGHHQVFCITHLPQIAACASLHFKVEKQVSGGRTRTLMSPLDPGQRIEELARMLSGDHPTPQTRAFAAELIARRRGEEA